MLIVGCSQEEQKDQNIELIESFLEYDLTAPNEEAIQANDELWKWLEKNDDGTPSEEYESFLKETYGTYLTESGLEHFKTTGQVSQFHLAAEEYGYETAVKKIEIKQNEDTPTNYNFTATVEYEKGGEEKLEGEIKGIAIVRPEGIAKITYQGDKEFLTKLLKNE